MAECERKAREADVLVCLVAHRYGFEPEPGRGSITRREVEAARAAGKDVLVWIVADNHPWSEKKEQDRLTDPKVFADPELVAAVAQSVKALHEFKTWLRATCVCDTFTTPEDLGRKIAVALSNYLLENTARSTRVAAPAQGKQWIVHALQPAPHFHGRKTLLEELGGWVSDLDSKDRVWSLVGPGGSGKTAVAQRLVGALGPRTANLLVWSFYARSDVNAFLHECNQLFLGGEEEGSASEGLERLQRGLRDGRPHLLVLDGLEQVQVDAGGDRLRGEILDHNLKQLLRALAAGLGQTRVLVTSRFPLVDLEHWAHLGYCETRLNDLTSDDAVAVLRGWGVKGSDEALAAAAAQVGYHALSVAVIGSYLHSFASGQIEAMEQFQLSNVKGYDPRAAKLARILTYYSKHLPDEELDLLSRICCSTLEETLRHSLLIGEDIGYAPRSLLDERQQYFTLNSLEKRGLVYRQTTTHGIRWSAHPFLSLAFGTLQSGSPERISEIGSSPVASLGNRPARWIIRSRVDNAIVTKTNLLRKSGIGIDQLLIEMAGLRPGERVMVVSITTGARIETFLAAEKKDSGIICMNGVAANRIGEGEEIIIYGFELVGYGNMPNKPCRISVEFNRGRNVLKKVG